MCTVDLTVDVLYSMLVVLKRERKLKHFSKNNRTLVTDVKLLSKMRINTDMAVHMLAYDYLVEKCDMSKYYLRSFDYDIINVLVEVGGGIVTNNYLLKLFNYYSELPESEYKNDSLNAKILLLAEIPSTDFNTLVYLCMLYNYNETLELLYKYYSKRFSINNLKDAIVANNIENFKFLFYKMTESSLEFMNYASLIQHLIQYIEIHKAECMNYNLSVCELSEFSEFLKMYSEQ